MKLIFRHASSADFEALITIARFTVDNNYRRWLDDKTVDQYLATDSLDRYVKNNIKNIWIALQDEKIVGFAVCIDNVIDFMLVDFKHQRQGIGSTILEFCEEMLFAKHKTIALESFENNSKANTFYNENSWKNISKYVDPKSSSTKLIFSKKFTDKYDNKSKLFNSMILC